MAASVLCAFEDAPDARLFGIRRSGNLDCVALVFDAAYQPRGLTVILFLIRMVRVLGWRMSRTVARVLSEKPTGEERRLELMILGTRADSQGQGLARAMLHPIFEFARVQGYRSVLPNHTWKIPTNLGVFCTSTVRYRTSDIVLVVA